MSKKKPFADDSVPENKLPENAVLLSSIEAEKWDAFPEALQNATTPSLVVPAGYTPILIKQEFSPSLLTKIEELTNELSTITAIQTQADAEKANASLKKAKTLINTIEAERKEMTSVLDEKKKEIMGSENDLKSELLAMVQLVNGWVTIFQKAEAERIKKEQEKIEKEKQAELKAKQAEIDRKAKVTHTIIEFEKAGGAAVAAATLEDIDDRIELLKGYLFKEDFFKERISEIQSLKMLYLQKFKVRKFELQEIANGDADAKLKAEARLANEKAAIEEKEEAAQMDHMEASVNAAQNIQMGAEFKTSMVTKQKGVMKKWTFDEASINIHLLPIEFHTFDKAKIKEAIASGRTEIPGVKIFQDIINVSR